MRNSELALAAPRDDAGDEQTGEPALLTPRGLAEAAGVLGLILFLLLLRGFERARQAVESLAGSQFRDDGY